MVPYASFIITGSCPTTEIQFSRDMLNNHPFTKHLCYSFFRAGRKRLLSQHDLVPRILESHDLEVVAETALDGLLEQVKVPDVPVSHVLIDAARGVARVHAGRASREEVRAV